MPSLCVTWGQGSLGREQWDISIAGSRKTQLVPLALYTLLQQMATLLNSSGGGELTTSSGSPPCSALLVHLRCLLHKLVHSLSCSLLKQFDFLFIQKWLILIQLTRTLCFPWIESSHQTFLDLGKRICLLLFSDFFFFRKALRVVLPSLFKKGPLCGEQN